MARERVRFFAEWFCEFPLWPQWDQDAEDFIRDKEFPGDLVERLRKWNEEYNEQPHGEPPHSFPPPREWFVDFDARGRALADEVAAYLGPGYRVQFKPQLVEPRRRGRRLLVALLAVAVLLAVVAADWLQQRREYEQLVNRTSHALRSVDGFLSLGIESQQEAAQMQKTLQADFAKVEQVSVLPWHRDMRAFRAASIELGKAWAADAEAAGNNSLDAQQDQVVARKFSTITDRLYDATPAFTEPNWGTLFP